MKTKLYSGWKPNYFGTVELTIWNTNYISEENGYTGVQTFEVELDIIEPTRDEMTAVIVKELRSEQGKLVAQANAIENKIKELLCIEHKEVAA